MMGPCLLKDAFNEAIGILDGDRRRVSRRPVALGIGICCIIYLNPDREYGKRGPAPNGPTPVGRVRYLPDNEEDGFGAGFRGDAGLR